MDECLKLSTAVGLRGRSQLVWLHQRHANGADETSRYGCQWSNPYHKATKDVAHKVTTWGLGPLENIAHGDAKTVGQQVAANYS